MIYAVFVLNERETTTDLIRFQWLVLTVCCVCVSEWISFVSLVSCCISGALALVKVVLLIPSVSLVSAIDWPAAFICDWAHELSSWVACGWYRESSKHAYQTERIIRLVSSHCRRSTERLSKNWKKQSTEANFENAEHPTNCRGLTKKRRHLSQTKDTLQ